MPLDFPSSPALNQVYSLGGKSWKWNGAAWETYNDNLGVDFVETVNGITGDVSVTGGTSISVVSVGKTLTVNYTGSSGGAGSQGATGATGPQGVTGAIGFRYLYTAIGTGPSANNGVSFGAGYISGNYAISTPHGGSNTLYIPATDYHGIDRSDVYEFFDGLPGTGIAGYQGHLYVQSVDRELVSAYRIGSILRIGPYSGATSCYIFNWSSGQEGSATGGAFNEGERFAILYVAGGQQGAQGAKGDPVGDIDGGTLTVAE